MQYPEAVFLSSYPGFDYAYCNGDLEIMEFLIVNIDFNSIAWDDADLWFKFKHNKIGKYSCIKGLIEDIMPSRAIELYSKIPSIELHKKRGK